MSEKDETEVIIYKDGEPCKYPGCAHHVTHPCEACGRIMARGDFTMPKWSLDLLEPYKKIFKN